MAALGWGFGQLEQNVERKNRETKGTAVALIVTVYATPCVGGSPDSALTDSVCCGPTVQDVLKPWLPPG
jgi:hypothetical protein